MLGLSKLAENPVYELLSKQLDVHETEASVKHNFYKYLVNRNGVGECTLLVLAFRFVDVS